MVLVHNTKSLQSYIKKSTNANKIDKFYQLHCFDRTFGAFSQQVTDIGNGLWVTGYGVMGDGLESPIQASQGGGAGHGETCIDLIFLSEQVISLDIYP